MIAVLCNVDPETLPLCPLCDQPMTEHENLERFGVDWQGETIVALAHAGCISVHADEEEE